MISQLDDRQAAKLRQVAAQARVLQQDRTEASSQLAQLEKLRTELNKNKAEIQTKLAEAQRLLNTLTKKQQDEILASSEHVDTPADKATEPPARGETDRSSRSKTDTPPVTPEAPAKDVPASGRAAAAIAFAKAQIGKPYAPRGTGPGSYDCSGLTQASWKAANVNLSRTTWTQVNDGPRISKSALQPGDLVFFFADNSHVGIYIGGGQIVHAPRPGKNVTIAPVDSMSFYAAVRPG
nr:C40 family peptidase [Streptomyces sp. SID3343]